MKELKDIFLMLNYEGHLIGRLTGRKTKEQQKNRFPEEGRKDNLYVRD